MAMYYNGKKVRNLYYNGECLTRLALGKEMTKLVEGDDFVRAEWLVGDGTAYIDTGIIVNVATLKYSFKFVWSRNEESSAFFCGSRSSDQHDNYTSGLVGLNYTILRLDCLSQSSNFISMNITPNVPNEVYIDCRNVIATVNGNVVVGDRTVFSNSPYTFRIFDLYPKRQDVYKAFNGKISYFNLNDGTHSLNFTPCRLLRPIHAALDANGIARNAGECGMFDAVSGKFYGNVAASGVFTVEPSLVEGVDYERHKWLVGDGSAYIQGIKYDLWNNHLQMRIGKVREELSSIYYINYYDSVSKSYLIVRLTYYAIVENNILNVIFRENATSGHIANISPYSSMNEYVDFDFYINNTEPTCERDGVIFTNSSTNVATQSNWTSIQPQIHSAKMSYIREVLPNGSYRSNLVPVRLLRPLPSYLDANGKNRNQFECGMLDLKTMKFYGNVNTSGKFTVSDN